MREKRRVWWSVHECPFGEVAIASTVCGVCKISLLPSDESRVTLDDFFLWLKNNFSNPILEESQSKNRDVANQLVQYCRGELSEFNVLMDLQVNYLQLRVLDEIRKIPYGVTRSYSDIAVNVGEIDYREVAAINRFNPVPLVIPCHRVVCKDGSQGFYTSSDKLKKDLIEIERKAEAESLRENH